jgi:hypothetical protein
MKNNIILLTFLLSHLSVHAQENHKCLNFHLGNYKVEGDSMTTIRRTKKYQIEKNKEVKTKDKIIWVSDCKYKLVPLRVLKDKNGIIQDWILFFEIIETGDNYYIVRITNDSNDYTYEVKTFNNHFISHVPFSWDDNKKQTGWLLGSV